MEKRQYMIGVKVTKETRKRIEYVADREQRPMSSLINIWIEENLQKYKEKEGIEWEN